MIPPAKTVKGKIQQSELRPMKSSSQLNQMPAAGDVAGAKESFWLAVVSVQYVEGVSSPHQHNVLNKGIAEGETEMK